MSAQWKPRRPIRDRRGRPQRYVSPRGQASRLDVHPRNRNAITNPTVELWITEGVKKADALTSHGLCVVALTGVFNRRSTLGTLGDWEDVPLRGRTVVVCFDADAHTKPAVLRAMERLGRWLRSKGVKQVGYLIVPAEVNGVAVKGVDDFFAAGGTLDELRAAIAARPPDPGVTDDTFTDARLAETVADEVLAERFCWAGGLGWLAWDGKRWAPCTDVEVGEAVRRYALDRFAEATDEVRRNPGGGTAAVKGWESLLRLGCERAVTVAARVTTDDPEQLHDARDRLLAELARRCLDEGNGAEGSS